MAIRMDTEDVMMSTEDMAKIIPLTREALIAYIKNGDLEGFRIGRRYFVYSKAFYAWLETKKVASTGDEPMRDCIYYTASGQAGDKEGEV